MRSFIHHFNSAFPIFNSEEFWNSLVLNDSIDSASSILCQVYAASLTYWKRIPGLSGRPKPNVSYAANLADLALDQDFAAPGLSTITAAVINLSGRPADSTTGKAIGCGRTISLAHSLGLNRDPTNWKICEAEKDQRIRLWWGVLIHDRWCVSLGMLYVFSTSDTNESLQGGA